MVCRSQSRHTEGATASPWLASDRAGHPMTNRAMTGSRTGKAARSSSPSKSHGATHMPRGAVLSRQHRPVEPVRDAQQTDALVPGRHSDATSSFAGIRVITRSRARNSVSDPSYRIHQTAQRTAPSSSLMGQDESRA